MVSRKRSFSQNFRESALAIIVMTALFGLVGFSIFDETSRPTFLDVAKFVIGAYIGYLIPNDK